MTGSLILGFEKATSLEPDLTGTKHQSLRRQKLPTLNYRFVSGFGEARPSSVPYYFSWSALIFEMKIDPWSKKAARHVKLFWLQFDGRLFFQAFYRRFNCAFACLRLQRSLHYCCWWWKFLCMDRIFAWISSHVLSDVKMERYLWCQRKCISRMIHVNVYFDILQLLKCQNCLSLQKGEILLRT